VWEEGPALGSQDTLQISPDSRWSRREDLVA
jgi:hypothetical protein